MLVRNIKSCRLLLALGRRVVRQQLTLPSPFYSSPWPINSYLVDRVGDAFFLFSSPSFVWHLFFHLLIWYPAAVNSHKPTHNVNTWISFLFLFCFVLPTSAPLTERKRITKKKKSSRDKIRFHTRRRGTTGVAAWQRLAPFNLIS